MIEVKLRVNDSEVAQNESINDLKINYSIGCNLKQDRL